jgi:hypothetical protein
VWSPTWTHLDDPASARVASWQIDRGRAYELDRTDAATASVQINDPHGVLDPTNSGGPHYTRIQPLVQARIRSWNPVLAEWQPRFRGWVSDWDYDFDPSQQVNRLTLQLTDIFEILGAIEMLPGYFGDPPPAGSEGTVYFGAAASMDARVIQALGDAAIPSGYYVVFTGNVSLVPTVYSPGETPLDVIQDASDAEFPGVSNVYTDRYGRLAVHGRLAKFDPVGVASGAAPGAWDWHHWQAGDHAAVAADLGAAAQIRQFSFNRGLSKIINSALASPQWVRSGSVYTAYQDSSNPGQIVVDTSSQGLHGIRSWSSQNLQTDQGLTLPVSDNLTETKRFASYFVANYAEPRDRVTTIGFRSMPPGSDGEAITWQLLTRVDISDRIDITVGSPGGGGFDGSTTDGQFFVEGVHEQVKPAGPDMDDITVTLDLSPKAYFTDLTMFPDAP